MNIVEDKIDTREINKSIGEFMGAVYYPVNDMFKASGDFCPMAHMIDNAYLSEVKFNSSWEWLFPVIDKINGMGKEYHLAIFKTYVSVSVEKGGKFYKDFSLAHSENISATQTSREAAYKVVVKFVKWYNENLKQ